MREGGREGGREGVREGGREGVLICREKSGVWLTQWGGG